MNIIQRAPQIRAPCHAPEVGIIADIHIARKLHARRSRLVIHVLVGVSEVCEGRKDHRYLSPVSEYSSAREARHADVKNRFAK